MARLSEFYQEMKYMYVMNMKEERGKWLIYSEISTADFILLRVKSGQELP